MDVEEYHEPPVPEALISNAVERFNGDHEHLLFLMQACGENPSPDRGEFFNERSIATQDAFSDAVDIVTGCEELTARDRAGHIAALCINTEQTRLDFLQEVAPEGEFQEVSTSHEDLQGMFEEFIENDLDTSAIVESATSIYTNNLRADMAEFFSTVQVSRIAKMKFFLREEAVGFGKLAAAATLGALIADLVVKRSKR